MSVPTPSTSQQPSPQQSLPPADEPPRRRSPLIAILILIAVIAFAWYLFAKYNAPEAPLDLSPPPVASDAMTPAPSSTVEKEPAVKRKVSKPKPVVAKVVSKDRDAMLLGHPDLVYPPDARRANEQGTVVVLAQVDAFGKVSDVSLDSRSGSRTLDRAALHEVRTWTFRPAMQNGKAVASTVRVPVDYTLDDDKK